MDGFVYLCVPGFEWRNVMICAWGERPFLGFMRWWTTRGLFKDERGHVFYGMFKTFCQNVNERLIHLFDRGYAHLATLERLDKFQQDGIIRWKSNLLLIPLEDKKSEKSLENQKNTLEKAGKDNNRQPINTWRIAQSLRSMHKRIVWDKERKQSRSVAITYTTVKHPEMEDQKDQKDQKDQIYYLIVTRDTKNKGQAPMYLLTTIEVNSIGMAWMIFFAYMQRWFVEQAFRFNKSELAMQSPRLWWWENRLKLLAIVALIYDFLLSLLLKNFDKTL